MKIIPVIDLLGGLVVRGVAGRRSEYRPIQSTLADDASVSGIARGLHAAFGFDACYVADLDAIAGAEPAWRLYDDAAAAGLHLWIDAGTATPQRAAMIAEFLATSGGGRVVVGLESLADATALREIRAAIDVEQLVFSLDLKHDRPLVAENSSWRELSPESIATAAIDCGIQSMIVLDLAGVGVGAGVPTLELCRRLRAAHPRLEITSGGGVRGLDDLIAMRDAGCDAALVASALHDGRLTRESLAALSR